MSASTPAADRPATAGVRPRGFTARLRHSEGLRGLSLISPALVIVAVVLAAPVTLLVLYSFWTQDYVRIDTTFSLANYERILNTPLYITVFLRSIGISALVTLLTVLLAYPLAYFVAFDIHRNKMVWLIIITLPFWASYLLRVFTWKIILGYEGVLNSGLMGLGVIQAPLEFLMYNPTAVVITLAHAWAAFAILPIYVSLEKIDRSLLEAATDLGDNGFQRFVRIVLPLSLPGVLAASVIIFIPTIGDYITPALVGGPGGTMIGNLIQAQFGRANNWPLGAAMSIMAMIGVTALAVLYVLLARRAVARIR